MIIILLAFFAVQIWCNQKFVYYKNICSRIDTSFFSSRFADNYFIDDYARFSTLDTVEKNTAVANSMNYMTKKGKSTLASDHWVEKHACGFFFLVVTCEDKKFQS